MKHDTISSLIQKTKQNKKTQKIRNSEKISNLKKKKKKLSK